MPKLSYFHTDSDGLFAYHFNKTNILTGNISYIHIFIMFMYIYVYTKEKQGSVTVCMILFDMNI